MKSDVKRMFLKQDGVKADLGQQAINQSWRSESGWGNAPRGTKLGLMTELSS